MRKRIGTLRSYKTRKFLELLLAGKVLGFKGNFDGYLYLLTDQPTEEWDWLERRHLYRLVREFERDRLISYRELNDGTIRIEITEDGKRQVLKFNIDKLEINLPKSWDGKWRMVAYDIPERRRRARDALRAKLQELGFWEYQKSVFVFPYPCEREINFIIEFFEIRNWVTISEITKISNEAELRLHFRL